MSVAEALKGRIQRIPGMTQRRLASTAGISQPTLNRILKGDRMPTMPELICLAEALGCTVGELTGESRVAQRLVGAARTSADVSVSDLSDELVHYFELDAFLDAHGIPQP